jgi:hypothetical protein
MIRLIKWALFALGCAWAAYATWGVWVMIQIGDYLRRHYSDGMQPPHQSWLSNTLAGLQLGLVVLGPVLAAAALLLIRWPAERQATISN